MDWETKEGRCTLVCWAGAVVIGIIAYLVLDSFLLKLLAQILAVVIGLGAGVVLSQTFCVTREPEDSVANQSADAVAAPGGEPQPGAAPVAAAPATRGTSALAQPGSGGTIADAPAAPETEEIARPKVTVPPDAGTAEWDEAQESGSTSATSAVAYEVDEGDKPKLLDRPRAGVADNLTELPGVGPKVAEALTELGVYHFAQIASWTPKNIAWVEAQVPSLKGRAERNDWVAKAGVLARGGAVDKGDVVDE
ncbi:hypothetical protein [Pseudooceanicola sp. LIPI14-2-Ac024]|uniref:hypothetical protein n=1 Tax=Pseudooceanicola sp. LIPI14-2-Ac024 TaxID=3344875 RepID=UPI0035D0B65D